MHSGRWDWSYDLKNKRVALIGNGATAAQIAPEVAKVTKILPYSKGCPTGSYHAWTLLSAILREPCTAISHPFVIGIELE